MTLRKRSQHHRDHERGATAIMVAASLLLLMGLAAIAVDSGILFGERRQQASAADVGALAAVQFAKTSPPATHAECSGLTDNKDISACRGAEEALAVIEGTLPGRYTDGPGGDWLTCSDPAKPAEYSQESHISPCINFTSNLQRARVVLPGTDVDTSFAKALGFGSAPVGAFAEAGLELDISGGVLPFALGPTASGNSQACFFAQDSGYSGPDKDLNRIDISPCTSSTEGNFGKLNLRWYGNENYEAGDSVCSGQTQWRMAMNIITGTDHPLELESVHPSTIVNDVANCDNITNPVDEIETWTGNAEGGLSDGFFNGLSTPSLEGRLMCKGSLSTSTAGEDYPAYSYESTQCAQVGNSPNPHLEKMDHSPLWDYLNKGAHATGDDEKCAPGKLTNRAAMVECLEHWDTNAPNLGDPDWKPLFTAKLNNSPRFGAVPTLSGDPGGGTGAYLITDFKPVYIETMYIKCSANSCDVVHSPGEDSSGACPTPLTSISTSCGWTYGGNKNIEAVSALMLTMKMLHPDIAENFPYREGSIVYNLVR